MSGRMWPLWPDHSPPRRAEVSHIYVPHGAKQAIHILQLLSHRLCSRRLWVSPSCSHLPWWHQLQGLSQAGQLFFLLSWDPSPCFPFPTPNAFLLRPGVTRFLPCRLGWLPGTRPGSAESCDSPRPSHLHIGAVEQARLALLKEGDGRLQGSLPIPLKHPCPPLLTPEARHELGKDCVVLVADLVLGRYPTGQLGLYGELTPFRGLP